MTDRSTRRRQFAERQRQAFLDVLRKGTREQRDDDASDTTQEVEQAFDPDVEDVP